MQVMALYNQKKMKDSVYELRNTTSAMLEASSRILREQSVEIHKDSIEPSVNIESLKIAYKNTIDALADINKFKQEALPKLQENILVLRELAKEGEVAIERIDKSNAYWQQEE
jgi:uncharacterized protein YaaN involved in tellurite resistance